MNNFGDQYITPFGIIDDKTLDRIKRKVMKKEILKWITVDPARRHGFEILSEIRNKLQR
jgi:ABC-type Fe3+-citrate transport system substrate-binding protein